jgi:hypothetical protein
MQQEVSMSELNLAKDAGDAGDAMPEIDDEVDEVLRALRQLRDRTSSPVIRACLDAARADIVHLASSADRSAA